MDITTKIFIDGFNLYYGALKGTPFKWLDPRLLCRNMLPNNYRIESILYCTARVKNTPDDPTIRKRQHRYIQGLESHIPELEVIYGNFGKRNKSGELKFTKPLTIPILAPIIAPESLLDTPFPPIIATVAAWEEKMSDVNLASNLVNDANRNKFDCAVIISNDSDLAPALRIVKDECRKEVWVLNPDRSRGASKYLRKNSSTFRNIREAVLAQSQLPNPIPKGKIMKPDTW